MESKSGAWSLPLLTAVPPVAWGSTYFVTDTWLPPDRPLFAATVRALPIGLLILALRPQLPRGSWWWKSLVLGTTNIGLFFALIFVAAYRLPGGLASTVTAMSPLAVLALAWLLIGEQPRRLQVGGAVVGIAGVALLVLRGTVPVDPVGLLAAIGAVCCSALGFVLVKRWERPAGLLTVTAWQLIAGGLVLAPVAALVEGPPPRIDLSAALAFAYLGLVGTGLAYVLWFRGLTRRPAGSVSLIGLVNPVVGTALGVWFAAETFGVVQLLGVGLVLGGVVAGQSAVTDRWRRPAVSAPRVRAAGQLEGC